MNAHLATFNKEHITNSLMQVFAHNVLKLDVQATIEIANAFHAVTGINMLIVGVFLAKISIATSVRQTSDLAQLVPHTMESYLLRVLFVVNHNA